MKEKQIQAVILMSIVYILIEVKIAPTKNIIFVKAGKIIDFIYN